MIAPFLNQSLALDIIKDAPPAAAYGLRKLKSGYKGAPIRVRRSNDDAELDIPFCGQCLCIGTLMAFVTTNSAYVVTAYDQSGNANHATQTTAANQPRIVNAGIIDRDFDATKCAELYPTFASASGSTIVSNGDFSNGITNWFTARATVSVSSNTCSLIGDGTGADNALIQNTATPITIGKRYYVKARVRVTNTNCTQILVQLDGSTAGTNLNVQTITSPVQNQWYTVSAVGTIGSDFTGTAKLVFNQFYADAATANGKVMEVQEVICTDVTELGQPTMYFDGTNDVMTIANSASVDILSAPLMMNAVFSNANVSGTTYILSKNLDSFATNQYALDSNMTTGLNDFILEGNSIQSTASGSITSNTQKIYSGTFVSGVEQGYVNGSVSGSAGSYNSTLTSRPNMQIGARSNNAGGTAWAGFFKGNISEIIILTSTSGRSKLEKNQGKYFSLGVA